MDLFWRGGFGFGFENFWEDGFGFENSENIGFGFDLDLKIRIWPQPCQEVGWM